MDFLNQFYLEDKNQLFVNAEQASAFAQTVAGDFNPIHYPDSKRFCVPGDLLFAIALSKYGLHQSMRFEFLDMVKANVGLDYPASIDNDGAIVHYATDVSADKSDAKPVMSINASGENLAHATKVETLIRKYVAFSGQNFPHILLPLMEEHNVMINPSRPLVIYQSMSFELESLDFSDLDLKLDSTSLNVEGKRGEALLKFVFTENGKQVGAGEKTLLLSGLRPYEEKAMSDLAAEYLNRANGG